MQSACTVRAIRVHSVRALREWRHGLNGSGLTGGGRVQNAGASAARLRDAAASRSGNGSIERAERCPVRASWRGRMPRSIAQHTVWIRRCVARCMHNAHIALHVVHFYTLSSTIVHTVRCDRTIGASAAGRHWSAGVYRGAGERACQLEVIRVRRRCGLSVSRSHICTGTGVT